jgi:hypothetical protein
MERNEGKGRGQEEAG